MSATNASGTVGFEDETYIQLETIQNAFHPVYVRVNPAPGYGSTVPVSWTGECTSGGVVANLTINAFAHL
jgi:hypothetical protein